MSTMYDVVVIGAGPAGSSAAKATASGGLTTIILEKTKLPRYKMCSGILGPTSMQFVADNFGKIPDDTVSVPFDVLGFQAHAGIGTEPLALSFSQLDPGPGERVGCSIKRPEFDHWLNKESGAVILDDCNFLGLETLSEFTKVHFERKGERSFLTTKFVVGADGPLSKVRDSVNKGFTNKLRLIPNYEEWYIGEINLAENWLHCFYDSKVTSYFATVFHKDNNIIVVTGARQHESVRGYYHDFINHLKNDHGLKIKEKTATHGCVLHDMSATDNFYLGCGNVLLAGEAGGFNRCAEGISSALITGKAAGDSILMSMKTGKPAISYYAEWAAPEADVCRKASSLVEGVLGFNPFTR